MRPLVLSRGLMGDRVLRWSIALAAVLALNGVWWGWVESWNPDDWALRELLSAQRAPLAPATFVKPPFHTYINFLVSVLPLRATQKAIYALTSSRVDFGLAVLYCSRLIQIGFFLGTIAAVYHVAANAYGRCGARVLAPVLATSAGFVAHAHFLTTDIPVTFWMLASVLAAQSMVMAGRMRDYAVAGLLVGIATATKYNALLMALAIPIFHYYANRSASRVTLVTDRRFVASLLWIPAGFVLANPYAVLHISQFAADFMYNYATTPFYRGALPGTGYTLFVRRIAELIGWPTTVVAITAAIAAPAGLSRCSTVGRATTVAVLSVCVVYFLKFGAPARVEARFVLPVVPFLLLAGASLLANSDNSRRRALAGCVCGAVAYNVVASLWVGHRFATDPRMAAQSWLASHAVPYSVIESSPYSPRWNLYPSIAVRDTRMPHISGRRRLFAKLFAVDPETLETVYQRNSDEGVDWYTADALAARRPDLIALDSLFYLRFREPPFDALYPEMSTFLRKIMDEELGYEIVYEQSSHESPVWLYPHELRFVDNRIVILQRSLVTARPGRPTHR